MKKKIFLILFVAILIFFLLPVFFEEEEVSSYPKGVLPPAFAYGTSQNPFNDGLEEEGTLPIIAKTNVEQNKLEINTEDNTQFDTKEGKEVPPFKKFFKRVSRFYFSPNSKKQPVIGSNNISVQDEQLIATLTDTFASRNEESIILSSARQVAYVPTQVKGLYEVSEGDSVDKRFYSKQIYKNVMKNIDKNLFPRNFIQSNKTNVYAPSGVLENQPIVLAKSKKVQVTSQRFIAGDNAYQNYTQDEAQTQAQTQNQFSAQGIKGANYQDNTNKDYSALQGPYQNTSGEYDGFGNENRIASSLPSMPSLANNFDISVQKIMNGNVRTNTSNDLNNTPSLGNNLVAGGSLRTKGSGVWENDFPIISALTSLIENYQKDIQRRFTTPKGKGKFPNNLKQPRPRPNDPPPPPPDVNRGGKEEPHNISRTGPTRGGQTQATEVSPKS